MPEKPVIVVDFDTVIYPDIWSGYTDLPEEPIDNVKESLDQLNETFDLGIFSTRCHSKRGRDAVKEYLEHHEIPFDELLLTIPSHLVYISKKCHKLDEWSENKVELIENLL